MNHLAELKDTKMVDRFVLEADQHFDILRILDIQFTDDVFQLKVQWGLENRGKKQKTQSSWVPIDRVRRGTLKN